MNLNILYSDEHFLVVNKPPGLLVHKSLIASDVKENLIDLLEVNTGKRFSPIHRLDRKTSGIMLLAKNAESARLGQRLIQDKSTRKTYLAIVRGYAPDKDVIDYPLKNENDQLQDCITAYRTLDKTELPFKTGIHDTSRYSLLKAFPETGRMHQIRRHMAHIRHPIIADRPHGCNKQNKYFKEKFAMDTMLLHAFELEFTHPVSEVNIKLEAPLFFEFKRMLKVLNLNFS